MRVTVAALVGALIGSAMTAVMLLWLPSPQAGVSGRSEPSVRRSAPRHVGPPARPLGQSNNADCYSKLNSCALLRDALAGQLVIYEGRAQAWPEDVPHTLTHDALQQELRTAWGEHGEIIDLRCEEYPCIATIALNDGERGCCAQLSNALTDNLIDADVWLPSSSSTQVDGAMLSLVAVVDRSGWTDEVKARTQWRMDVAQELLVDESTDE